MGGTLAQVRVPVTDSQRVRVNSQDERRASAINQALLGELAKEYRKALNGAVAPRAGENSASIFGVFGASVFSIRFRSK